MIAIWRKDAEDKPAYVYCSAAYMHRNDIITIESYANTISENIDNKCNSNYPKFYATVGSVEYPSTYRVEIEKIMLLGVFPDFDGCQGLKVSNQI